MLDQGLWLTGGTRGGIVAFLSDPCADGECAAANRWTLMYLVESATFCDFESVTFCTDYRRDLWISTVLGVLLYMAVYAAMELMGLTWLGAAAFYLIPFFILWFSIGVSPRCLPMVPTCMLDAVVDAAKAVVPLSVGIPPLLVANNGTGVRSCAGLGLDAWHDPLVFALCDAGLCDGWSNVTVVAGVELQVESKRLMRASPDVAAYRVCAGVMAVNTVSALVWYLSGALLGLAAAWVLASVSAPLASLLWQVAVYDHE